MMLNIWCVDTSHAERDWIQLKCHPKRHLGRQTEGVKKTLAFARVMSRALVANTDEHHFKVSRSMMSHCQEAQRVHGRKV